MAAERRSRLQEVDERLAEELVQEGIPDYFINFGHYACEKEHGPPSYHLHCRNAPVEEIFIQLRNDEQRAMRILSHLRDYTIDVSVSEEARAEYKAVLERTRSAPLSDLDQRFREYLRLQFAETSPRGDGLSIGEKKLDEITGDFVRKYLA